MTKAIPMNGRMVRTTFAVIELLSVVRYINSRIANIMLVTVIFNVLYSFIMLPMLFSRTKIPNMKYTYIRLN